MNKLFSLLLLFCLPLSIIAEVQIKSIEYQKGEKENKVTIHFSDKYLLEPNLKISSYMVQLELNGVAIWPKIEQKFAWKSKDFDTTIMAYQYDKNLVRFRIIFPEKIETVKSLVHINLDQKIIEVYFPQYSIPLFQNIVTPPSPTEKDLEKLIQSEMKKEEIKKEVKDTAPVSIVKKELPKKENIQFKTSSDISYLFIFKYLFFLVLVIALFYGLIYLFKKGVFGKGKLGFLHSSNAVTILSNNYIAPKRSLMTVKVHNQLFLLSNCETGISFLAEIKDTAQVVKNEMNQIMGTNFDKNMDHSEGNENLSDQIILKKDINHSRPENLKLSFTDQIKKKVKNLRPLQ